MKLLLQLRVLHGSTKVTSTSAKQFKPNEGLQLKLRHRANSYLMTLLPSRSDRDTKSEPNTLIDMFPPIFSNTWNTFVQMIDELNSSKLCRCIEDPCFHGDSGIQVGCFKNQIWLTDTITNFGRTNLKLKRTIQKR